MNPRKPPRLRLALATVVVAMVGIAAPGSAFASGTQGNDAVAVNTKDGSSIFKFSFSVARVMGDSVTNTNAAVAYASCTDCQTTAIAIQIVIVAGDPSTFAPTNTAIAVNESCNLCDTLASAYQFVVQASGPVHFNADGNKQMADIRRQILALRQTTLTAAEIQARLDQLTSQLRQVLSTDLVPAGASADGTTAGSADPNAPADPNGSAAPTSTTATSRPDGATSTSTSTTSLDSTTTSSTPPPSTTTSAPSTTTSEPSTTTTSTP